MGLPTLRRQLHHRIRRQLHAENGFLGYGRNQTEEEYRWYYYNASGEPVTSAPGASVLR